MNNESHPVCRIFISHSSKDNEFGVKLAIDLRRKLGENAVWYDSLGLRAGVPWWHNIVGEVATRDVFILIISPEAMLSDWVRREYDIALQQKKEIIPLLYLKTENIWP